MANIERVERAIAKFDAQHMDDLNWVAGHGQCNLMRIGELPRIGEYCEILPYGGDASALLSAQNLIYSCMDKRQIAQVANSFAVRPPFNYVISTAAGPAQVEGSRRFNADVELWTTVLQEAPTMPVLYMIGHLGGCGGVKHEEGERKVLGWIDNGTEENEMAKRVKRMRDAVARNFIFRRQKPEINIALAYIDHDRYSHYDWI